ncbi:MAG: hypothetical protein LC687_05810 [Actinobacteria bacterium]|nr:hypothetical protein [Actinomycetota bacterium]
MRIRDSAHRHGIAALDIHHAIDNAVATGPVETNVDQILGVLYIGPDRTGRMLEIITVDDIDDGEVAIHAMRLRKTYERYLPREDRS